jgi:hypothetical protein
MGFSERPTRLELREQARKTEKSGLSVDMDFGSPVDGLVIAGEGLCQPLIRSGGYQCSTAAWPMTHNRLSRSEKGLPWTDPLRVCRRIRGHCWSTDSRKACGISAELL